MKSVGTGESVLLTGISGYLGSLVAAALLSEGHYRILAPIRAGHTHESIIDKIKSEAGNSLASDIDFDRITTVALPELDEISSLASLASQMQVTEIIHCAGSVDYFDLVSLQSSNIDLTIQLLSLGKQLEIRRFTYLSTAFSSGYVDGLIPEELHDDPTADPTDYTRTKRQAEALVAGSSLPFLIVRPSIVIGNSFDGRYSGKAYGLYQLWMAWERLLCDRYRTVLHFIAPKAKLQLIHQDAFQSSFMAVWRKIANDSIVHLVSRPETLPTVRGLTQLWNEMCTRPREVHYYDRADEIPTQGLDRRIRTFLEFTSVNSEIASHPWQFETTALDQLRTEGLEFHDATIETVRICQMRFMAQSKRIQTFLTKNAALLSAMPPLSEGTSNNAAM
jgi:nucleoside-diphosphate-sugar epimerase